MALLKDRFDSLLEKAKAGDSKSQYRLAKWLYNGHLVEKDKEAAKYWAFKAINGGHKRAQIIFEQI